MDRLWKQALHLIVSISHQGDTFMADARIFEDLKRDHDRHRQLLDQLAHIQGNGEERRSLFETLRKELQAHAAAEEESLYATMLGCPHLRAEDRHPVSEHKESNDKQGEEGERGG